MPRVLDCNTVMARGVGAKRMEPAYKRPFDVVMGTLLLVLSLPLFALIALLVKVTSHGPVLFCQERLGQHGRPFIAYKFRTMYHNADATPHREYFKQYLRGAPAPGQPGDIYKLRRDPRITPIGGVLRRLGLDELPQLINVVKGDMSLVGPRPPLAYEVEHYSQYHLQRLAVKPGITGLWQIRGRDVVDFETMVAMDLEYIERQSLALDLALLLLTIPAVVWAYFTR
jgi:lipopolysaccharide/colanic/teichoic acid biosynthesis glycosyltransferase